jgi:hypothetical protein
LATNANQFILRQEGDEPMDDAATTARKQRGRPFRPGQSGNPAGRRTGSRHKATLAMEALFEGEAEAIGRKAIEKAKEGDTTAMRLCLERIIAPRKDRPVASLFQHWRPPLTP